MSDSFGTNAIGTLTYDPANDTLYAGTGEPNASGDSEAGIGIYKSTDGGNTWAPLSSTVGPITTFSPAATGVIVANGTYTGNAFLGRAIGSIVVDPTNASHLYVSSARGVRGVAPLQAVEPQIRRRQGRLSGSSNQLMAVQPLVLSGMAAMPARPYAMAPIPRQLFAE